MDFEYSEKVDRLRTQLDDFMRYHIEPANREWHQEVGAGRYPVALVERDLRAAWGQPSCVREARWQFHLRAGRV